MPSLIGSIIFLIFKQFYEFFSIFYQGVVTFDLLTYARCYISFRPFLSIKTQIFSLAMKIDSEKRPKNLLF